MEVKRPVMPPPIIMMFNGTAAGLVILAKGERCGCRDFCKRRS